jgi:tetratricopeptide (TPR) repeat protein
MLGLSDGAISDLDQAGQIMPEAKGIEGMRCLLRGVVNRDLNSALASCNRAITEDPKDPDPLDSRGFVHFRLGEFAAARADYDAALALAPKSAGALFMRGILKQRDGDAAGGAADIAAAKAVDANIAAEYAGYGVKE